MFNINGNVLTSSKVRITKSNSDVVYCLLIKYLDENNDLKSSFLQISDDLEYSLQVGDLVEFIDSTGIVKTREIVSNVSGITKIDSSTSSVGSNEVGAISGVHEYSFVGNYNKPKLDGAVVPLNLNLGSNAILLSGVGEKSIAGNSWNSSIFSSESFNPLTENFAVSWLVESVTGTIREMGGLDNNPTQNNSYNSIEFAIYQVNNYFYSRIYESGSATIIPNYSNFILQVGDRLGIKCINQIITYFVLRGGVETEIYTSLKKATEPLFFKAAFNRGSASSGKSVLGDVVFHSENEVDSFRVDVKGFSQDLISIEDSDNLYNNAGIEILSGSSYSSLEFQRLNSNKFKNSGVFFDVDYTHEYRNGGSQSTGVLIF